MTYPEVVLLEMMVGELLACVRLNIARRVVVGKINMKVHQEVSLEVKLHFSSFSLRFFQGA